MSSSLERSRSPTTMSLDELRERVRIDRLANVFGDRAVLERDGGYLVARDDDDRDPPESVIAFHDREELPAGHHRHLEIEDDESRFPRFVRDEVVERVASILGFHDFVAAVPQVERELTTKVVVVVDEQDR